MNGRKAKQIRALAGVNKENRGSRSYHGVKHTVRTKTINHPTELNEDGTPKVMIRFQTATYALNQGSRLLSKILKRNLKHVHGMTPRMG